jgi:3-methyladenine DNA glycosylase AlkC
MEPLKNLFRTEAVLHIAGQLEKVGLFHAKKELQKILNKIDSLELKERVKLIAETLATIFPNDIHQSYRFIEKTLAPIKEKKALGNEMNDYFALNPEGLHGFLLWPFTEFIASHGLDHPQESLQLLKKITILFTGEFAIRPFIIKYQDQIYEELYHWAQDENEHIRRLASEGSRPRLPWGIKIESAILEPSKGIKILELLKYDDSLYVRKSVANHLNDITKDNPEIALKIFKKWKKELKPIHKNKIEWIIKHGGRNLIKAGHPQMLQLIGVNSKTPLKLKNPLLNKKTVKIGETVELSTLIENPDKKSHKMILDYKIYYIRPSGKQTTKIFKGNTQIIKAHQKVPLKIKIPFKNSSIRTHFAGLHQIEIYFNGNPIKKLSVILKK